jgi:hypothetical protein
VAQGLEFVEYVTDQVDDSCSLTHRMMFGDWLTKLLTVTTAELPAPRLRKKKNK